MEHDNSSSNNEGDDQYPKKGDGVEINMDELEKIIEEVLGEDGIDYSIKDDIESGLVILVQGRENKDSGLKEKLEKRRIEYKKIIKKEKEKKTKKESYLTRASIGLYGGTNFVISGIYKYVRQKQETVDKKESIENMNILASKMITRGRIYNEPGYEELEKNTTLEEKLSSLGNYYVTFEKIREFSERNSKALFKIGQKADLKGIIVGPKESIEEYVYRANSIIFMHRMMKGSKLKLEIDFNPKESAECLKLGYEDAKIITRKDIVEANKRIPYYMDLSWICGFVDPKSPILAGAYGVCFTFPEYNGFNFLMMRENYKSREHYLKVLSHEMTHMGTVFLDSRRDLLETKAYTVGSAAFGEYTIALNQRKSLIESGIQFVLQTYVPFTNFQFVDRFFAALPKIRSAIKVSDNIRTFNSVRENLKRYYGKKGDYIAGRLSADEVEEFAYTNNIPVCIERKNDLKWTVMKRNLKKIRD